MNNTTTTTDIYTARKNGKRVRIRVRRVGFNAGWVGELVGLNGRVVDDTDVFAFSDVAHTAALALTR